MSSKINRWVWISEPTNCHPVTQYGQKRLENSASHQKLIKTMKSMKNTGTAKLPHMVGLEKPVLAIEPTAAIKAPVFSLFLPRQYAAKTVRSKMQ
jgi:hypothetical protein